MNALDLIDSELANHHHIIEELETNLMRCSDDDTFAIRDLIKKYRHSLDDLLRDQRLLMEAEISAAIKEVPLFSTQAH